MSARYVVPEAAAASRKRDLSAHDIANLIQPVALELLGTPNKGLSSQSELRFGSNGSLSVAIGGDRIGQWISFEDGEGGGVLDLIVRERGGSRATAVAWVKSRPYCYAARPLYAPAGRGDERRQTPACKDRNAAAATAPPPAFAQPPAKVVADPEISFMVPAGVPLRPSVDAPMPVATRTGQATSSEATRNPFPTENGSARKDEATALWRHAQPIAGTPAELYLIARGLDPRKLTSDPELAGQWPETLRFTGEWPGMALLVAVQRIFVRPDGRPVYKAEVYRDVPPDKNKKIKLSLGPIDGNCARFSSWPDPQGRWGLGEGPETALAAQQLLGFPVWSAISAGNMAKVDPPHWASEAFVFADHDAAGMQGATASAIRLSKVASIRRVRVIRAAANGADVADALKESAR